MSRSSPQRISVTSAPNAANGKPGENRDRVDEALVQHAEDHVDHEHREQHEHEQSLLRRHERLRRCPRSSRATVFGSTSFAICFDLP